MMINQFISRSIQLGTALQLSLWTEFNNYSFKWFISNWYSFSQYKKGNKVPFIGSIYYYKLAKNVTITLVTYTVSHFDTQNHPFILLFSLWRHLWYQGLYRLVDSKCWRGSIKYYVLLTQSIYSTVCPNF